MDIIRGAISLLKMGCLAAYEQDEEWLTAKIYLSMKA
jgi:hypothetical protein